MGKYQRMNNHQEMNKADFLASLPKNPGQSVRMGYRDKIYYLNLAVSLKVYPRQVGELSFLDHFAICVHGNSYTGTTWEDMEEVLDSMAGKYWTGDKKRLCVFVHDLPYDFQFLHLRHEWLDVFATDIRDIIYGLNVHGVEFRDSAILSGLPYGKLALLVDNPGYQKPETEPEKLYNHNQYIYQKMIQDKGIAHIKITATKYVKDAIRNACIYQEDRKAALGYMKKMQLLRLSRTEYDLARKCFEGGAAHCNLSRKGQTLEQVHSRDITSAYSAVQIFETFPMGRGQKVEITSRKHLEELKKTHCLMMDVMFVGIRKKEHVFDLCIREKNCECALGQEVQDGYIVSADKLVTSITDVDLETIGYYYEWDELYTDNVWAYQRGHLPKEIVCYIIELYNKKSELKGDKSRLSEYNRIKALLNSIAGMMMQNIVHDDTHYLLLSGNEEEYQGGCPWEKKEASIEEALKKYNDDTRRFTSYLWGVWITAYQRRNLAVAVVSLGGQYVYSDTDCVKYTGDADWLFEGYNKIVQGKADDAAGYYGIDIPSDLGRFAEDGEYRYFKTLGTKQYLSIDMAGKLETTVAGLAKTAADYIAQEYGNGREGAEMFRAGLTIPKEYSGLNQVEYIDDKQNPCILSRPVDFTLGQSDEYIRVLDRAFGRKERGIIG